METELIAKICHESNRAYCESIDDYSQPHWESAPKWQRQSAINGVMFHLTGEGNKSPRSSHENWLKEKEDQGWKYGEKKDENLKTHPCFLPYDDLPESQRIKDKLFVSIVSALSSKK